MPNESKKKRSARDSLSNKHNDMPSPTIDHTNRDYSSHESQRDHHESANAFHSGHSDAVDNSRRSGSTGVDGKEYRGPKSSGNAHIGSSTLDTGAGATAVGAAAKGSSTHHGSTHRKTLNPNDVQDETPAGSGRNVSETSGGRHHNSLRGTIHDAESQQGGTPVSVVGASTRDEARTVAQLAVNTLHGNQLHENQEIKVDARTGSIRGDSGLIGSLDSSTGHARTGGGSTGYSLSSGHPESGVNAIFGSHSSGITDRNYTGGNHAGTYSGDAGSYASGNHAGDYTGKSSTGGISTGEYHGGSLARDQTSGGDMKYLSVPRNGLLSNYEETSKPTDYDRGVTDRTNQGNYVMPGSFA